MASKKRVYLASGVGVGKKSSKELQSQMLGSYHVLAVGISIYARHARDRDSLQARGSTGKLAAYKLLNTLQC